MEGHNEPCYYCEKPCDNLAANPGMWSIALCHADEPGVVKWHHTSCISDRLVRLEKIESQEEKSSAVCHDSNKQSEELKDRSKELADLIVKNLNSKEFEIKYQLEAQRDIFEECYGAKLLIEHKDGSTYEIIVNPINDIYDPDFGDDKVCNCGHPYHRHFDSYTVTMEPIGCKYCQCYTFTNKDN